MKKYLLFPGNIQSKTDRDIHYICASKLAQLYGVKMAECVIAEQNVNSPRYPAPIGYTKEFTNRLIRLYPDYSGDYTLPTE